MDLEQENEDEAEEEVVQRSVISSEVNTHGAESESDTATPVLRIEMRDACGAEIAISGLTDLIDIAMPLQRSPPTPSHHTLSLPLPLPPPA